MIQRRTSHAPDEVLADRIRLLLKRRKRIGEQDMFDGIAFMPDGNMAVGTWQPSLVVRPDKASHDQNPNHSYVREFDATGRVMKGWLMVDPDGIEDDRSLDEWVTRGIAFARTLPPKDTGEKGANPGA